MITPNGDSMESLLRQNQWAAEDVESDEPPQLLPGGLSGFVHTQVEINKAVVERLDAIDEKIDNIQNDMGQVKGGIGDIKGKYARYEVERDAHLITFDLGLQYLREIERDELAKWAQALSHKGVAAQTLRSFRRADLVIEASKNEEKMYVAVEVSYTADRSDSDRVMRNAEFLRQLTGCEAKAVVASVQNDYYVAQQVEKNLVHWYQIDEDVLKAD